jgi:hypothetical protein
MQQYSSLQMQFRANMPPITPLQLILQAAQYAPSADNSQPWRLEWQDPTLSVVYDYQRLGDKTFPADNPATIMAMGAVLENIRQAAQALNLALSWKIPSALDPVKPVYFQTQIEQIDENSRVPANLLPLFKRHTNRLPYQSQVLPEALLDLLKNLTVSSARTVVINQPSSIMQVAHWVRLASEIRFRTREVHEWLGKSLRFQTRSPVEEGLDVNTLDLPPGGKAFLQLISSWQRMKILNLLGAYNMLSFIDSKPIKQAPALVAIISPSGFQDTLAAGQLMERIWIDLNVKGVAVHPYYVIADQLYRRQMGSIPPELKNQADTVFEGVRRMFQFESGETLQMLLRVGYPKKTPVLSKRLPVETVCSGITSSLAAKY